MFYAAEVGGNEIALEDFMTFDDQYQPLYVKELLRMVSAALMEAYPGRSDRFEWVRTAADDQNETATVSTGIPTLAEDVTSTKRYRAVSHSATNTPGSLDDQEEINEELVERMTFAEAANVLFHPMATP